MNRLALSAGLALAILVGGCDDPPDDHPPGVRTVESLGGRPAPPVRWTLLPTVASVHHAVRFGSGWAILDVLGPTLHLLADEADAPRTGAGPGEGPGELQYAGALASQGDALWVVDAAARRIQLFGADGRFERVLATGGVPCPGALLHAAVAWPDTLALAVQCIGRDGPQRYLGRIDTATGVARWSTFAPASALPDGWVTLDRMLLARGEGQLARALSGRPCLWLDPPGTRPPCRPAHEGTLLPAATRVELQRELAPRARGAGLTLGVPTHDPFAWGLLSGPDGWILARGEGTALVLEPDAADPARRRAGRVRLPPGVRVFAGEGQALLVRDVMEGTEVARLPLGDLLDPSR